MTWAHFHLMINHFPVMGSFIAALLLAAAVVRRNDVLARWSLGIFVFMAIAAVAVYFTGEPAEEIVEGVAGVSQRSIETHEEAALTATIMLSGFGLLAFGGLLAFRRSAALPRTFSIVCLLLSLAPLAALTYTANAGGRIRHTEIAAAVVQQADEEANLEPLEGER
jgi:uncharacterized membrane protein